MKQSSKAKVNNPT